MAMAQWQSVARACINAPATHPAGDNGMAFSVAWA